MWPGLADGSRYDGKQRCPDILCKAYLALGEDTSASFDELQVTAMAAYQLRGRWLEVVDPVILFASCMDHFCKSASSLLAAPLSDERTSRWGLRHSAAA